MNLRALPLLLSASLLLPAATPRTETRTEPLAMGAKLWIKQEDGLVDVKGWDKEEVQLVAEFVGTGGDQPRLEVRKVPDGLEIEVLHHRHHFLHLSWDRSPVVNLTLMVPRRLNMDVRTVDGGITVRDLDGYAGCRTVDGPIDLRNIRGEVHARAVDGSILARDLKARLKGGTVDGNITLDRVEGGVHLETVDGAITAEGLDGWGEGISLHTVDGNIHVKLGQAKGELEARSVDGRIHSTLAGGSFKGARGNRLTVTIPGRDQKISLRTVDGRIELE